MKGIKVHRTCRLCKHPLTLPLSLGEQYLSDFPSKKGKGFKAPLDLALCGNCQLVQLKHTVNRNRIYRHYFYRSSANPVMVGALKEIVDTAVKHVSPKLGGRGIWCDIGANDGTLLQQVPNSYEKVAFEPALNFAKDYPADIRLISDYFTAARFKRVFGRRKARVITAIAMFYDLDNPHKFVADIMQILDREGIIVIQQNYLPFMLIKNAYDNIGHEHVCYYNLTVLEGLLRELGLETIHVSLNEVNGGSFRTIIARKDEYPVQSNVKNLFRYERKGNLKEMLQAFQKRVDEAACQLHSFIAREIARGHSVMGYGAGNRGNTILQFSHLNPQLIRGIIDANSEKWGKYTVGTNIPIHAPVMLMSMKPDYLLILPYFYLRYFLVKERAYLDAGGKFIVPLPEPRIIGLRDGEVYTEQLG